jgi:glycosyltransferase involved in cell wall biosynthesis
MKIAHISPLTESVPPKGYGGIERVVAYLVEEQIRLGHQVTLFASGDSQTSAELVPGCNRALGYDPEIENPFPYYRAMLDTVRRRARGFDILHFHFDFVHFLMLRDCPTPMVTTLHGWPYLLDLLPFYPRGFNGSLVSVSIQQRQLLPQLPWLANVYHGLPLDLYPFSPKPKGDYFAFIGRLSPEKGPDEAIAIARMSKVKLRIAGNVKEEDRHYFEKCVAPHIDGSFIEYIGEVSDQEKAKLLSDAKALLFPIQWPEPFGLVLIEAMACGTPVIAYRSGSVAEVVEPGITGFVVETARQAAAAAEQIPAIDRALVRRRFEERFSVKQMAEAYLAIYRRRLAESTSCRIAQSGLKTSSATHEEDQTIKPIARLRWLRMEFNSGKAYARERARNWRLKKRLLFIGGAPLIPLVRSIRILKQLVQSETLKDLNFRNMFPACAGLIVSALGEMAGYSKPAKPEEKN